MNFRQEKRLFYNWLKRRNLLDAYNEGMRIRPLRHMWPIRKGEYLLLNAFNWHATPQGHMFWLHMQMKWIRYLHKKQKKY
jgi:hypothetical protein